MTSKHRHGTGTYAVAGDTDAQLTALSNRLALTENMLADTIIRVKALEAPPVIVPAPTPSFPTGTTVVSPGWTGPKANGVYALHAGTYRFGFTAAEVSTAVTLLPYGDGEVIIDGTGLDPHFVYLGPGAAWDIGAITVQGFAPSDSGVIGIGDSCRLDMTGTKMRFGSAPMTAGAAQNRHLVYFHGTGTGLIENGDFAGAPGAALQSYRGSPVVTVNGGRYEGAYRGALIYSGTWTINDAYLAGSGSGIDAEYKPGMLTLNRCTGPAGAVRTYQA